MKICELCGGRISARNTTGVCIKTPECVIENRKRTKANNAEQIKAYSKKRYTTKDARTRSLYTTAKQRAEGRNIPFSITLEDLVIPDICPVLGIEIRLEETYTDNVPTVDRIVPTLGYIPGNVAVISNKANRLKSDATSSELRRIADWMDAHGNS